MANVIDRVIGDYIRDRRESVKLSVDSLAQIANLSVADYTASEKGARRFSGQELALIAPRLGVGLVDIVDAVAATKTKTFGMHMNEQKKRSS